MHRGLHIHTHTRECVGVAKKREGDAFIITRVGISRGRILFNPTRTVRAQHDASPPSVMLHSAPRRRLRLLGCPTRQHRRCGGCRGDSVAALRHHHRSTCARRSKCVFRCPSGRGAKDMVKVEESSEQIPPIFCRKSGTRGGLASVTPSQTTKKNRKSCQLPIPFTGSASTRKDRTSETETGDLSRGGVIFPTLDVVATFKGAARLHSTSSVKRDSNEKEFYV